MGDPVYDFLDSGGKTAPVTPTPAAPAKSAPSNDPTYDFLNSGGKNLKQEGPKQAPTPLPTPSTEPLPAKTNTTQGPYDSGVLGATGHFITGAAAQIVGGWRGLAALATGATAEDAANAATETARKYTYQPEAGSPASKIVDVLESPSDYNPLTAIPRLGKYVGNKISDAGNAVADSISDFAPGASSAVRSATPVIAAGVEGGINAAPAAIGGRSAIQSAGKGALRLVKPTEPIPLARVEPVLKGVPAMSDVRPEPRPAQPNIRIADIVEPHPTRLATDFTDSVTLPERQMTVNDPTIEHWPPEPAMATKGPLAAVAPVTKSAEAIEETTHAPPKFLEGPPESGDPVANASRAKILKRVGLNEARSSAITGDAKAGATDYQTSKLDNAAGNYMRSVLDGERSALQNHAEGIVRDTGGTIGTDSSALYGRGSTILAPLDGLKQWFDTQTKKLYAAADEKAAGQPVQLPKTQEFIGGDQAEFLGTTEGESLLKGLKARMKSLGMTDAEGNPQPVTIKQAEQLKQYLNNQWQPRTGRLIRGMKDAIDEDVTASAGEDVYQEARQVRRLRAVTLDDPNGIAKIMDASGPDGINRAVPVEKVADTITGLPADQLGHIIETLKGAPPEIQAQAQAALAEIKAQFANKVLDAGSSRVGQWGARDVSKYLNNNAARLKQVFTSEELDKFNDLNDAGHILAKDQSYPGAAVQEHNLIQRGVMGGIRSGAAAVGGALGGAPGAAAGDLVGGAAAKVFGEKSSLKATQKRVVRLQDFPGINK